MIPLGVRKIQTEFPERQFKLGQKILVREITPKSQKFIFHTDLRVIKILEENLYLVQDQKSGEVYSTHVQQMFLDEFPRKEFSMYF